MNTKCICILFALFLCKCTDVPLSYSKYTTDTNLIGFWQETDSTGHSFLKTNDGKVEYKSYKYDIVKKKYIEAQKTNSYFTDIKTNGKIIRFISFSPDENKTFITYKYEYTLNGDISLTLLSFDFLNKFNNKQIDGKTIFGTSENFRNYVKRHINNPELFLHSKTYARRRSFNDLLKPQLKSNDQNYFNNSLLKRNGSYGIYKMRSCKYIKELKTWDDYSDWSFLDENYNNAKFFPSGIRLKLYNNGSYIEYFGTNLSFSGKFKSSDGSYTFYNYTGLAKFSEETIGNFTLSILDAQYSEILTGSKDNYRFDVHIDCAYKNFSEKGFWGTLFNGVDQIKMNFLVNTK